MPEDVAGSRNNAENGGTATGGSEHKQDQDLRGIKGVSESRYHWIC